MLRDVLYNLVTGGGFVLLYQTYSLFIL